MHASHRPVRVAFIMEQHLGHRTYYQNLRRALSEASDIRAEWVEVTYQDQRLPWEHVPFIPSAIRANLTAAWQVRSHLAHHQTDALFFSTQVPAVFALDSLRRKPAIIATDITPVQYDKMAALYGHRPDRNWPIKATKHAVNKRVFNSARHILPWSTWARQSLLDDYGVRRERIEVLPVGVDLTFWKPAPKDSYQSGLPRILFVGGDFERKGGRELLQAFQQVGSGRAELHLVTRQKIELPPGAFAHTNLAPNTPELHALFAQADLFVLPSLGEAFGIAAVEASAAGLPAIVSDSGGLPDIVADGETGFVVPAGDVGALSAAMAELLHNPERRREMSRAARSRAEALFDMRRNGARVAELVRQAVMRTTGSHQIPSRIEERTT